MQGCNDDAWTLWGCVLPARRNSVRLRSVVYGVQGNALYIPIAAKPGKVLKEKLLIKSEGFSRRGM